MAQSRQRTSGIFPGLVLITVGALLLLHNYRGLELGDVLLPLVASRAHLPRLDQAL